MKRYTMWQRRSIALLVTGVLLTAALCAGLLLHARRPRTEAELVAELVPAAASIFAARGAFVPDAQGWKSAQTPGASGPPMVAHVPLAADQPFSVNTGEPQPKVELQVEGMRPSQGVWEGNAVVYRDARDGLDLVALHDPEYLELAFVARDQAPHEELALRLSLADGETLREEPSTGAILVEHAGRPRLRVAPPVVFDRNGQTRTGTYRIEGERLALAMRWEGLAPPLVVDPKIAIPVWWVLGDDRVPGSRVNDPERLSKESHWVRDSARHRTVLVRPVRAQQTEDTMFLFGAASRTKTAYGHSLWNEPDGEHVTELELQEWARGYSLESETWEWDGAKWTLNQGAHLPGFIDPALAFDEKRSRVVLFGGAAPSMQCSVVARGSYRHGQPYDCRSSELEDVHFEYDGHDWIPRNVVGAPSPRVRAAMTWDPTRERIVLFGGRALDVRGAHMTNPYGRPFPENIARDLLADTWLFDGAAWSRLPAGNPPPASEGAQLVADPVRHRIVQVGGHTQAQSSEDQHVALDDNTWKDLPEPRVDASDVLSIWELDDNDWVEKVRSGDASLPEALRNRRAMSAFWNPVRQRVTLFGGRSPKLSSCTLTDEEIVAQKAATEHDPTGREALAATGCLGGYLHDTWEWDGSALTRLTDVTYGGLAGDVPVFVQASGAQPWAAPAPPATAPGVKATPLLPWRYDPREQHFRPRTTLERAHMPADVTSEPMMSGGTPGSGVVQGGPASPLFASQVRANVLFDEQSGRAVLQSPGDRRVLSYDGAAWETAQEVRSPFDVGPNDFFAAAWDGARQQLVLFDPTTGQTWLRDEASGWSLANDDSGPVRWSLPAAVRTEEDLPGAYTPCMPEEGCSSYKKNAPKRFGQRVTEAARELPRMAYDSTRGRVVMVYRGGTWQWDGTYWTEHPAPPGWESCRAAVLLEHDVARGKTVAIGCTVPGQTWEWDGSSWEGPFPGPYHALIERDDGLKFTNLPAAIQQMWWWEGTLQLAWAHPNAAAYSAVLGGVSTLDADGTLRTWNGQSWEPGPALPYGNECRIGSYRHHGAAYTGELGAGAPELRFPWRFDHFFLQDFVPMCMFPPLVEDAAGRELWVMRDSIKGMMSLDLDEDSQTRAWRRPKQDREWSVGMGPPWAMSLIKPYPFELMSAEHVTLVSQTDASARVWDQEVNRPSWAVQIPTTELTLQNLWWPYRLLRDEASGRIRVLTHRGQLWEMGTQVRKGLGETCQKDDDCGDGTCTREGVCCNLISCGWTPCSTCKGSVPGVCEMVQGRILPDWDGNLCTFEFCDNMINGHRVRAPAGAACNDENACNGSETCDGQGTCVAGVEPDVDDNNPCTTDTCDAIEGVRHVAIAEGSSCTDNNLCNGAETCDAQGTCVAGSPLPIDDGDPCTQDTCDPQTGVMHASLGSGGSCVDGQGRGGTCDSVGTCFPKSDPAYEDGNPCTYDSAGGHDVLAGYSCEDGDVCNGAETCSASGECVAGVAPVVDDGDPSTLDMCDPAFGVVHVTPPPIDRTIITTVSKSTEFLYKGSPALQSDVAANAIERKRASVVRGRVRARDGSPLGGVRIRVHDHPELGKTATRVDGVFDMAVNGGGPLTVTYEKRGYLPAHRQVHVPWRQWAHADDVVMIPLDAQVTTIEASSPDVQVASGSVQSDASGTRQAKMVFAPETQASMVLPDGSSAPIAQLRVRATEYTVGDAGPASMPAKLPPTSGYTYAMELSVDEALAAGATDVQFSKPVSVYVDNYLGFPTGTTVPVGYYSREKAAWVPSDSGLVISITGTLSGVAEIDVDGDSIAESDAELGGLGITLEERQALAAEYVSGQTLWRVAVEHFSPWDLNWGISPPECAKAPGGKSSCEPTLEALAWPQVSPDPDDPCVASAVIGCESQTLGQGVAIAGTGQSLGYNSARVPGFLGHKRIEIPLSGDSLPDELRAVQLEVQLAGRRDKVEWRDDVSNLRNLTYQYIWDGLDVLGNLVQGKQRVWVYVGYAYPCEYTETLLFGLTGDGDRITSNGEPVGSEACEITLWRDWQGEVGGFDATAFGNGGWTLSAHEVLDPNSGTMYSGSGSKTGPDSVPVSPYVYAGMANAGFNGDGEPPTDVAFDKIYGLEVGPDDAVYVGEYANERIRRIWPDGHIETLVDGVHPWALALGPDGSLYYLDGRYDQSVQEPKTLWKRTPDGDLVHVAGNGQWCNAVIDPNTLEVQPLDGGPAVDAYLCNPVDLTVAPDGSVYLADAMAYALRKVAPNGNIYRIAGTGRIPDWGASHEVDGPAKLAPLQGPQSLDLAPDGSLVFLDADTTFVAIEHYCPRVLRLDVSGIVSTLAGRCGCVNHAPNETGCAGDFGKVRVGADGEPVLLTNFGLRKIVDGQLVQTLSWSEAGLSGSLVNRPLALDQADLPVYVGGTDYQNVLRIGDGKLGIESSGGVLVPSADGSIVHEFDEDGRHQRSRDSITGDTELELTYEDGLVVSMRDGDGNTMTVARDASTGRATGITAPFGQQTALSYDSNGYLRTVTNPAQESATFMHDAQGLLREIRDPKQQPSFFDYDPLGKLTRAEDAAGAYQVLTPGSGTDFNIKVSSAAGVEANYALSYAKDGTRTRTVTLPDGLKSTVTRASNGNRATSLPDGTIVRTELGPDPRFGMQAPLAKKVTVTTPEQGLEAVVTTASTVNLTVPTDPLTVTGATDTTIINGKSFFTSYDAATKSVTNLSAQGRTSSQVLDDRGRVHETHVPGVLPVVYHYDDFGRVDEIVQGTRNLRMVYDPNTGYLQKVIDAAQQETVYQRDAVGRVLVTTLPGLDELLTGYDDNGNLSSLTPPGRPAHVMSHTSVNLLEDYVPPPLAGVVDVTTHYTYDGDNRLERVKRPGGAEIVFDYDDVNGRLNKVTMPAGEIISGYQPDTGVLVSLTGPYGVNLGYQRDGSLLTAVTWSGEMAGSVTWQHNDDFLVESESVNGSTITFDHDNDGLLTLAGELTITPDPLNGRLTSTALDPVSDSYQYDAYGQLESYEAKHGQDPLFGVGYTYDALGRIKTLTETIDGQTHVYEYGYHLRGWLKEIKRDGQVIETYTYDANGNRDGATHDDQDRILSHGEVSYTWTEAGELETKYDASSLETTTYHYDDLGALARVELPDGRDIEYVIDPSGRRVGKKIDGVLQWSLLYRSGLQPVAMLDGSGAVVARFVYGLGRNVPDYMVKGGQTYRLLTDHRGSVRLVVRVDTGEVAQRIDYDAWGVVLSDTSAGFQPFGYGGGIYDPDTGLVRFGARDYDVETGRWMDKDPIGLSGGVNLFLYAGGDPVNMIDVDGRHPGIWILVGIAVGAALTVESSDDPDHLWLPWWGVGGLGAAGLAGAATPAVSMSAQALLARGAAIAQSLKTASQLKECQRAARGGTTFSRVIPASKIGDLATQPGTVVLGKYKQRVFFNGVQVGVQETLPILQQAARQLGGRTLSNLPGTFEAMAPEIQSATRIVFFTSSRMSGLTAQEMAYIQSDSALRMKTIFVYGGF